MFVVFQTTVNKKKMYYNMRVKTLERNMSNMLKQVEDEKTRLKESPSERIRNLTNILKTVRLLVLRKEIPIKKFLTTKKGIIDKIGERFFIPSLHFKITHMPSYYFISLRLHNGEQK